VRRLCSNCRLESWIRLNDIRTVSRREYCGQEFNITAQLTGLGVSSLGAVRQARSSGRRHSGIADPAAVAHRPAFPRPAVHQRHQVGTDRSGHSDMRNRLRAPHRVLPERTAQSIGECNGNLAITEKM
jgi:hypothetical protein